MQIRVRGGEPTGIAADVLIVPVAAGQEDGRDVRRLARRLGGTMVKRAISAARFRGRPGQAAVLPVQGPRRQAIAVVGLGDEARIDLEAWRRVGGQSRQLAGTLGAARVVVACGARPLETPQLVAFAEGFELAAYRFAKYKSESDAPPAVTELTLVVVSPPAEKILETEWRALATTLSGVTLARDLVNEPPAVKTPAYIADVAKKVGQAAGLEVEVWDAKRIASEKLAALIAVARGSSEEPRFVHLRYRSKSTQHRIALVGKGITFDSGGLSLKPAKSMETMKCDMAGAAAVLGAMTALARLKPAIDVDGYIPITENLPGGRAQKPGDVIRYRNGKTVEVLNTDAEGRLVLADALLVAADAKPDAIIDLATLTGACMVALGTQVAGLFANDQKLADRLLAAGTDTGEPLWQMPLVAEYKDDIKSAVADIKNIGGGHAGSITAALFLQEFVGSTPWVHLDIAGPAFLEKALPYTPKGGTGFGVRTLVRYLTTLAA